MSSDSDALFVIEVDTGETFGPITGSKGDLDFPEKVRGWSDVLDCRHKPYTDLDRDALLHFAKHVNKFFLLVPEHMAVITPPEETPPPSGDGDDTAEDTSEA